MRAARIVDADQTGKLQRLPEGPGKMRSLLEWRSGAVKQVALGWKDYDSASGGPKAEVKRILQLFGISGDAKLEIEQTSAVGPTRVAFWDCNLKSEWERQIRSREDNLALTEVKSENRINRISGVAEHLRQSERLPAGAKFEFRVSQETRRRQRRPAPNRAARPQAAGTGQQRRLRLAGLRQGTLCRIEDRRG